MSSNLIFTSANREKGWVFEILANNFPKDHIVEIDFDTPFCVFKVPKTLTETKREAYTPQKMGLGPYHHLRPDLYPMQKQKLAAVRKFMNQDNLNNVHKVVEALIQCEPVLRACYDRYLDLDANTLAWIVAIDGLYLLQFFKKYTTENETTHDESSTEAGNSGKSCDEFNVSDYPEIVRDIVMLENQIPVVLLKKILHVHQNDIRTLFKDLDGFCLKHSPLKLSENGEILQDKNQDHLLHRMYHLIVNNYVPHPDTRTDDTHANHPPLERAGIIACIVSLLKEVPWDDVCTLFQDEQNQAEENEAPLKKDEPDKQDQSVEEIDIPSVTQMSEIAGITFVEAHGGIRNIQLDKNQRKFHLPKITINVHTETVLRNMVAFELSKPGSSREFMRYVDLMCGIIDTKKDVAILKNANIIKGQLPEDEIVRIFNGIRRSTEENDEKLSNIKRAIDDVYKKYDDVGSFEVKGFLKKYFCHSWKYVKVYSSVVGAVYFTVRIFSFVFRLEQLFGVSAAVKGGHFLYADQ